MNSSSELIKKIHKKVTEVKLSKKMEVEYMTLYMRDMENREEGREEGQARMAALTEHLLEENRTDDLKRALKDIVFRNELFEQYGIT